MLALRVLLLAASVLLGALVGAFIGGVAGFGLNLLILASNWSRPPDLTYIPTGTVVGGILGVAVVAWLSWRVRQRGI